MLKKFIVFSALTLTAAASLYANSDDGTVPDTPVATEGISRWLELDAASFSLRYRNSFDTNGEHIFDDVQQRSLLSGKVKLDKEGKYFVGFRAESGRYFNWSYANISGAGYGQYVLQAVDHLSPQRDLILFTAFDADPQGAAISSHLVADGWQFYMRDLYASATPIKGLTFEFGGIPIERGVGTEITTYDDDGYMSGERVTLQYPKQIYLDKVEVTSAYVGDFFAPNFFDRYDRLGQSNYRQILGEKHYGKRLKASADYTWSIGTNTVREAVLVRTNESHILDSVRVELYQRVNNLLLPGYQTKAADGWAFTASKHLTKRITVEGGYADIDQDYGVYSGSSTLAAVGFALNGDSYQVGKRFFGRATVKLLPGASLFGFYTHQISARETPVEYSFTRQNFNFGMQLDFKEMLQRAHIL